MWRSSLSSPTLVRLLLPLLLAAGPGARAQSIDNNFGELYGVGTATASCLDDAAAGCSGSTGVELNSCLCERDSFALNSARCIARASPGDLSKVYTKMRQNCMETGGYTLVVDQAEWDSAASSATATTETTPTTPATPTQPSPTSADPPSLDPTTEPTSTDDATTSDPTSNPTSNPTTGSGPATVTVTPSSSAASEASDAGGGGIDTGVKIGVGVAAGVGSILLIAGIVIWLKWRKRQRKGPRYADRDSHIMDSSDMVRTYPAPPGGAGGVGAGAEHAYHKPPVGGTPSPDLRGGGGGGFWGAGDHQQQQQQQQQQQPPYPYHHPQPQPYAYPDHPAVAELGDGSDVTSNAHSGGASTRYSELPAGVSSLYPPPSSPSPVSPGPNTPSPRLGGHEGQGQDPRGGWQGTQG